MTETDKTLLEKGFSHPCKETCSGWQQGYEKGKFDALKKDGMDFEKFGKSIWDAAINAHKSGAKNVVVPFRLDDGGICRVTVSPPTYVESMVFIEGEEARTRWRHGIKQSNGSIKWGAWQ